MDNTRDKFNVIFTSNGIDYIERDARRRLGIPLIEIKNNLERADVRRFLARTCLVKASAESGLVYAPKSKELIRNNIVTASPYDGPAAEEALASALNNYSLQNLTRLVISEAPTGQISPGKSPEQQENVPRSFVVVEHLTR